MLNRYRLSGVDQDSGEVIEITLQAERIEEATANAARCNISVQSVTLEQSSSLPLPSPSEDQDTTLLNNTQATEWVFAKDTSGNVLCKLTDSGDLLVRGDLLVDGLKYE